MGNNKNKKEKKKIINLGTEKNKRGTEMYREGDGLRRIELDFNGFFY